jgi:hypothetical protein
MIYRHSFSTLLWNMPFGRSRKTHQLSAYADDVNLVRDNTDITKNSETQIDVSKDLGLEANAEKT